MSEIATTTTTSPPKTVEQHMADLSVWFNERGLVPVVVALGKRTNTLCAIDDFLPETHTATFTVQVRK